jgi:hypothetical protein
VAGRKLRALRAEYQALADRHHDLIALSIARLVDLDSSLEALHEGLPRLGSRATKSQIVESRRRLQSITQALQAELDLGGEEVPLLVAQTGSVRAVLASVALTQLLNFTTGEVNDAVDSRHLVTEVVESWEAAHAVSTEALQVGQLTIALADRLAEADADYGDYRPPMTRELSQRLERAETTLRRAARTTKELVTLASDARYRGGALEGQAEDIAGMRQYAEQEGVAPGTAQVGSVLRMLRSLREPSDAGRLVDAFAEAEAALSRAMRDIDEARRRGELDRDGDGGE